MNIFFLSYDPRQAAQWHLDKHVVKMVTETAQLLSTAHRILDGKLILIPSTKREGRFKRHWQLPGEPTPVDDSDLSGLLCYRATHPNVPLNLWVRQSSSNYNWLYQLFLELLKEYTYRYGRVHACSKLIDFLASPPKNIPRLVFVDPPAAMPDKYKINGDIVESYKRFYVGAKHEFAKWKVRPKPEWYDEYRRRIVEELCLASSSPPLSPSDKLR